MGDIKISELTTARSSFCKRMLVLHRQVCKEYKYLERIDNVTSSFLQQPHRPFLLI